MTKVQREMVELLDDLLEQVKKGKITGIALVIDLLGPPGHPYGTAVHGTCSSEPIRTIGMLRILARTLEDRAMEGFEPTPSEPATGTKTGKPAKR